jgi:FtsP/CotA-like multicopper oxidase with cupredoxin domain
MTLLLKRVGLIALTVWLCPLHAAEICPRPAPASVVAEPQDLRSTHGVLKVDLTLRNEKAGDGTTRYCYLLGDGSQAPTLRLEPGDLLILRLKNGLLDLGEKSAHQHQARGTDPCNSGAMTLTSTNLHFHGLTLPPICHQDDVLKTSIQPTDPPFEYRFRIPAAEPPGLNWYHPHIHGFSSKQVLGGASGALVVEGVERANPELAGLPERVLVIRDQDLVHPDAVPVDSPTSMQAQIVDRDGDAANTGTGAGKPAKDLSVNFVPVPYPDYPTATIAMRPGERQLWRVVNATSVTYLNLATLYKRGPKFRPQWIGLVAIDGVPLKGGGGPAHATQWRDSIVVSPGARVEFIVEGPPVGAGAMLVTKTVNTGPAGENDPNRPLISMIGTPDAAAPHSSLPATAAASSTPPLPWLGNVTPTRLRKLYFSEDESKFYLTVDGQTPATFDPANLTPNIVVKQGDVEDWIIENRSSERHAFHIHQIHFEVLERLGLPVNEPFVRDTVDVPFYTAAMQHYPSIKVRMDFRDPNTVGTFVYHCHLLDHEDGGMMGVIRVEPASSPPGVQPAVSP